MQSDYHTYKLIGKLTCIQILQVWNEMVHFGQQIDDHLYGVLFL